MVWLAFNLLLFAPLSVFVSGIAESIVGEGSFWTAMIIFNSVYFLLIGMIDKEVDKIGRR